ncbi:MAG TPA: glycosyltransferase [Ignavibacteria bacterium]|nr:glycosyltransferase [Ignavibacteria bacterium]
MIIAFIVITLTLFICTDLIIAYSLMKLFSRPYSTNKGIKISIIIAAKNEENNIAALIESLKNQDYPVENFEVVIIDDNSTDDTLNKTQRLIGGLNNFSVRKIIDKEFSGKRGALDIGIKKSKFPYLMITDADCKLKSSWLSLFAGKFIEGYDFVFGMAPYFNNGSLVSNIACFENLRSSILTFAATNLGVPYSASARSLGFKKESFMKVDGYLNTTQTLSGDDDLLLREAIKSKLRIGTVTNSNAYVYSQPKVNFKDYIHQKARHTSTSFYYLFKQKLILSFWYILNLFLLFSIFLVFINKLFLLLFITKLITDVVLVQYSKKKFGYKFKLAEIIYLQVFYEMLIIINFFTAKFMKVEWK